ncbi:hypothetical protein BU25DRAFT_468033, partial [Macroventuria anomochaeta]
LGYSVSVNIPELVNGTTSPIIKIRLTGNANTDAVVYNETAGLFDWIILTLWRRGLMRRTTAIGV